MQRQMRHIRQTRFVHTDERRQRLRADNAQRVSAVFGVELWGLVHSKYGRMIRVWTALVNIHHHIAETRQ